MKSIQQWKDERFAQQTGLNPQAIRALAEDIGEGDPLDPMGLKRVMGSGVMKVDLPMRNKLRPKIMQIVQDNPDMSPSDVLRQIVAVAGSILGDVGANFTTTKLSRNLSQQGEE